MQAKKLQEYYRKKERAQEEKELKERRRRVERAREANKRAAEEAAAKGAHVGFILKSVLLFQIIYPNTSFTGT